MRSSNQRRYLNCDDSGGYYCWYEIDTDAQIMGNSTKLLETNSGRFVKSPSGWAIVGGWWYGCCGY